MYISAQMEQFSRAYVSAIAAQVGCNSSKPDIDDDSIDIELSMKDIPDCKRSRAKLDIQLKCTQNVTFAQDKFPFSLSIKNYDDLRANVYVPRLLVVVHVPEKCEDWIQHSEKQLCLYHCAYWLSLAGKPETENIRSITVHIPRANLFSMDFLREAMRRCANGEVL